jgi:hypothetical protein
MDSATIPAVRRFNRFSSREEIAGALVGGYAPINQIPRS